LWKQRKTLAGKEVTVRGQVVKANNQILGKNWIHLQDGSGVAADRTNDITITTDDYVKVGEVVTIKGVLAIGRDIGGGYAYDAIVENARVVK
jgi:DNA/RNA endonuclease YhcR with UshA esterase domain